MARFTLEIELGNEAMQEGADVAEALARVGSALEFHTLTGEHATISPSGKVRDANGNTCGRWEVL